MVDQDDAPAQPFHVFQIVSGEDDRRAEVGVDVCDEFADALLRDDVQADGRLVQVEQSWLVEHGGREVTTHPLTQ